MGMFTKLEPPYFAKEPYCVYLPMGLPFVLPNQHAFSTHMLVPMS